MGRIIISMAAAGLLAMLTCCAPPPASQGGFDSRDPAAKLYAIQRAGEQRDRSAIPHLIEQLNSDDAAVRMYAIIALEKITGTRMDYSPYDPAYKRDPEIQKWVEAYKSGELNGNAKPQAAGGGGDAKP